MTDAPASAIERARKITSGASVTLAEALALERELSAERQFGLGRKVLDRLLAASTPVQLEGMGVRIAQRRCLCTYKDPDRPFDQRLDEALAILQEADNLGTTRDQETLGLAGSIFKSKWELTPQERLLERSLSFYYRGYLVGLEGDCGYTAVNAAFVLDRLAALEVTPDQPPELRALGSGEREALARKIRQAICSRLPALANSDGHAHLLQAWWFRATIAEAYFGLGDDESAWTWLKPGTLGDVRVPDWELEATARQLASVLRLRERRLGEGIGRPDESGRKVLADFLDGRRVAMESVVRGRVGLALSGGGFRASLYHIGVLARLAELDFLRHVEYVSCVSGGSIVGAYYYLEVRHLLQTKEDHQIGREDYVALVERVATGFVAGVQRNIRVRIAAEWLTNLRLIFVPNYTRTQRAGELYESELYARVLDGEGDQPRLLDRLEIRPANSPGFSPKSHNWKRRNKVPILVLNATCLNTGHNWQFTTSWMGEPPASRNAEIDANPRLRRLYYGQAPVAHRHLRLGAAVAASACVPGIFEPLALGDLYERAVAGKVVRPIVRLVDGGVFDNQGVDSLLEQDCSVLLVSDASGQMSELDFPSNSLVGVPLRANSILQARVRGSQFQDLAGRRRGGLLRGLMFVHLKKGLESPPVDWLHCQDPSSPAANLPLLPYGIQRHVQRRIAAIRTDLDSFSEVEALALMCSGYLMTRDALRGDVLGFSLESEAPHPWDFQKIEPLMQEATPDSPLMRQLAIGSRLFGKAWAQVRALQVVAGVVLVFLLGAGAYAGIVFRDSVLVSLTVSRVGTVLAAGLLSLSGLGFIGKILNYRKTASDVFIGLGMSIVGFLAARIHLWTFDKVFLRRGSFDVVASESRVKD